MFSILFALACNTASMPEAMKPTAADLGAILDANDDLDGNGYSDSEQTTIVAKTELYGAVQFIRPGPQLPGGIADGQPLELRGAGCNEYTSDPNCWMEGFMAYSPIYDADSGALQWYGVGGLRDGDYEGVCANEDAELGTLNGWCLPGEGATAADDHELVVHVVDGSEGCYRDAYHWAFSVRSDWVESLGYSFAPRDESCPEE